MKDKDIASILRRHYVGNDTYIFNCEHTVFGNLDEDTGVFTDRNGDDYVPLLSSNALSSAKPICYSNAISFEDLKDSFSNIKKAGEVIKEFDRQCKEHIYIIKLTEENKIKCLIFDINSLNEIKVSEENEENEDNDMDTELKKLIMDVINGEYSLEELREIREDLLSQYDDFESAIDSIELQIEATEKGESFVNLAEKKENEEKNYRKREHRSKKKENNNTTLGIDIDDLFKKVTRTLIAQDEPARRVIAEIARKELEDRKKKEGILLTGSTGVGKTELMRLIAKYLNKPFFIIDSTQLTIPGYTGKDIEEALWELYEKCGENKELAESAIIFFDEIDKKGSRKKSDASGQGVLNTLLPFIEGTTYQAKPNSKSSESLEISTDNMTVILGGAFTDVYKNEMQKRGIGFTTQKETKTKYNPTTSDFVEKGMMTDEFMGRVTVIKLNDLEVDDIIKIMKESDKSAIHIQEKIFKKLGTKIKFTDDFTRAIAEEAYKKKTGARGLNGIIDESTWQAFEEVYKNPGIYDEVILNEESVHDSSKYQLVKKLEKN